MRCSNCTEIIKPIVAIDIDGTLGNYHRHLLNFAEDWLGVERETWVEDPYRGGDGDIGDNFGDWFCNTYDESRETYRNIKLAFRQGGMKRTMPAFANASNLTTILSPMCEVWLTTTRPYMRLDSVDPDTREWLSRNQINYDHLMYDDNKYERLSQLVSPFRVIAVLDDLPEMYDVAAKVFSENIPILRRSEWNTDVERQNIARDLVEAQRMIIDRYRSNWLPFIEEGEIR